MVSQLTSTPVCKWCGRKLIVKATSQHPISCPDCATVTESTSTFSNLLSRGAKGHGNVSAQITKYKTKRSGAHGVGKRTLRKMGLKKK